jgi:hypothetical protein
MDPALLDRRRGSITDGSGSTEADAETISTSSHSAACSPGKPKINGDEVPSIDASVHALILYMTTKELSADIKKIYKNLATIEAKCITIDATQAAEPKVPLTNEQWQTLVALHRTLRTRSRFLSIVIGNGSCIMHGNVAMQVITNNDRTDLRYAPRVVAARAC